MIIDIDLLNLIETSIIISYVYIVCIKSLGHKIDVKVHGYAASGYN